MKPSLPLVSIVIANYNHADTVVEAIDSVISQDYPNKQIVVVDDCSTDNSVEVIRERLGNDKQINDNTTWSLVDRIPVSFISLPKNVGRSAARNAGIRLAWEHTHIFGNLDSDDTYLSGKISKSVAKILEDPQTIGAVYSDFEALNVSGGFTVPEFKDSFDFVKLRYNCIVNNDSLVTKPALDEVGLYDESMEVAEDWDLWLRISTRFMILHIPETLVRVRITDAGATSTVNRHVWEKNWMKIRNKIQRNEY